MIITINIVAQCSLSVHFESVKFAAIGNEIREVINIRDKIIFKERERERGREEEIYNLRITEVINQNR